MRKGIISNSAVLCLVLLSIAMAGCSDINRESNRQTRSATVTASAYTMSEQETKKGNIGLAAWGDQLEPGMKAIAVSRDLIARGLKHNTEVEIEGLEGTYRVLDKMNKRWENKIDIFMGTDREKAREWGKRQLTITWQIADD